MQSVIYSVISEYLSDSDVKPELQLSLWAGHCELRDVDLNCEALSRDTGLPVCSAHVKRLFISVPWSSLYTQSVEIEVSGLKIRFQGDIQGTVDAGDDEVSLSGKVGDGDYVEETVTAKLLSTIRDNVSLRASDVSVSWGDWLDVHFDQVNSQSFLEENEDGDEEGEPQRALDLLGISSSLLSGDNIRLLIRHKCIELSSTATIEMNVDFAKLLSELPKYHGSRAAVAVPQSDDEEWSWLLINIPLLSITVSQSLEMLDLNMIGVVPVVAFALVRLDLSCIECKVATLGDSIELLCNSVLSVTDLYTENTRFPVLLENVEIEAKMIDNQLEVLVQESRVFLPPLLLKQITSSSNSQVSGDEAPAGDPSIELHLKMMHPSFVLCRDFTDASTSMIIAEAQDIHMDNDGGVINALQISTLYDQEMAFVVVLPTNIQFSSSAKADEVSEKSLDICASSLSLSVERAEIQQAVTILEEVLEDLVAAVEAPIARSYSKTTIHFESASAMVMDGVAPVAELLVEGIDIVASSYVSRKSARIMELELRLETLLLLDRTGVVPQLVVSTLPPTDIRPLISVADLFDSPAYAKLKRDQNANSGGYAFVLRYETRRYHNRVPHIRLSFDAQDIRVRHDAAFFERLSAATEFGIAGLDTSTERSLVKLSRAQLMWQYFAFRLEQRKKLQLFNEGKRIQYAEPRSLPPRSTHWLTWNSLSFYLQSVITKLSFKVRRLQLLMPGNVVDSGIECFIDSIDCANSKQGLQFSSHLLNITMSGLEAKLLRSSNIFLTQPRIECVLTSKSNKSVDGAAISNVSCQMANVGIVLDERDLRECVDVLQHLAKSSQVVVPKTYASPSRRRHMSRAIIEKRTVFRIDSLDVSLLGIQARCHKGLEVVSTLTETVATFHEINIVDLVSGDVLIASKVADSSLRLEKGAKTIGVLLTGYELTAPNDSCQQRISKFLGDTRKSDTKHTPTPANSDLIVNFDITAKLIAPQFEASLTGITGSVRIDPGMKSIGKLSLSGKSLALKDVARVRQCDVSFDGLILSVNLGHLHLDLESAMALRTAFAPSTNGEANAAFAIPPIRGKADNIQIALPGELGSVVARSISVDVEAKSVSSQFIEWDRCVLLGFSLRPQGITCDRVDLQIDQLISLQEFLSESRASRAAPPITTRLPHGIEWCHEAACTLRTISFRHTEAGASSRPELLLLERWNGARFESCGPIEAHPRDHAASEVPVASGAPPSTRWRVVWDSGTMQLLEASWRYTTTPSDAAAPLSLPFGLERLEVACPRLSLRHDLGTLACSNLASSISASRVALSCDARVSTSRARLTCPGLRVDLSDALSCAEVTLARKAALLEFFAEARHTSVANNAALQVSLYTASGRRLCDVAPLGGTAVLEDVSAVHSVRYGAASTARFGASCLLFEGGTRLFVRREATELIFRSATSVVDATGHSLQLLHAKPCGVFLSDVTEELIVGGYRATFTSSGKGKEEENIWDDRVDETAATWQRKESPLDTTMGSALRIRGGQGYSWSEPVDISVEGRHLLATSRDAHTLHLWCCVDSQGCVRLNPTYLFQNRTGVPLWARVEPLRLDLHFAADQDLPVLCAPDPKELCVHFGFSAASLSEANVSLADTKSVVAVDNAKLYVYVVNVSLTNSRAVMINTPIRIVNLMQHSVSFGQVSFKRLVEQFVIEGHESRAYAPAMEVLQGDVAQFSFGRAFEFGESLQQCQHLSQENSRLNFYMGQCFSLDRRAEFASTFQVPLCLERPDLCGRLSTDIVTCYENCIHVTFNRATRTHEISVRARYSVVNRSSHALTLCIDSLVVDPEVYPLAVGSTYHIGQWVTRKQSIYDSPRFRIGNSLKFSPAEPGHAWLIELPDEVTLRTTCLAAVSRRVSEHRVEVELRDAEPPFIIRNFTAGSVWLREQWGQRQHCVKRGQWFPMFPEAYRHYVESQRATYVTDEGGEDEKSFTVAPSAQDITQFPLSLRKLPLHLGIKCGVEGEFHPVEITRGRTVHLDDVVTLCITLEGTAKVLTLKSSAPTSRRRVMGAGIAYRFSLQVQYFAVRAASVLEMTVKNVRVNVRNQPRASVARLEASADAMQIIGFEKRLVRTNRLQVKLVMETPIENHIRELWIEFSDVVRIDVDYLELTSLIEQLTAMVPSSPSGEGRTFFLDRFEVCQLSMLISLTNSLLSVQNLSLLLDSLAHEGCSVTTRELFGELLQEYLKVQLLAQSVRILGSLDIVGNPAGASDALARGLSDFSVAAQRGRAASVALLFRGVAEAATTSLIAFSRAGSQLTGSREPGVRDAGVWGALASAARGFITEPARGLGDSGVRGMISGFGRALRGLAGPASATFDSASRTLTIVHEWMGGEIPEELPRVAELNPH